MDLDFTETKVSYDDYVEYKRLMHRMFSILKRYKCCEPAYRQFETICREMELRLDRYLGE